MNRLAVTRVSYNDNTYDACILLDENRDVIDFSVFSQNEKQLMNQIYIARVEKIVSNINAAFVKIGDNQKCYLSLEDLKSPIFTKKISERKLLCEGDELFVQVIKDAIKTKDPVVSTKLTFHGKYCLLTTGNTSLGISKKIKPQKAKELGLILESIDKERDFGLVLRTNAGDNNVSIEEVKKDIIETIDIYKTTIVKHLHNKAGVCVSKELPGYIMKLKALDFSKIDCLYTDQNDMHDMIAKALPHLVKNQILSFYQDDKVSLSTLFLIQGNLDNLVSNRVWLKSGANIIIESLETLTVIDVNTGKNISKKADTIFRVNIEAAKEVARQLRLRNISGMIIIDFINMKTEEEQNAVIQVLKEELKKDTTKSSFIDITKLGLVEVTRKKTYKSLKEMLKM